MPHEIIRDAKLEYPNINDWVEKVVAAESWE